MIDIYFLDTSVDKSNCIWEIILDIIVSLIAIYEIRVEIVKEKQYRNEMIKIKKIYILY